MFHVALVLAAAMVVTAVVDIAQGRVPLVNEALHIPELFSVLFLWLLARPANVEPTTGGPAPAPSWDLDPSEEHEAQVHQLPRRPRDS
jgi:hypothetical protein